MTEWRAVAGYDGYEVSDAGTVRSVDRVVVCSNGARQFRPGRELVPSLRGRRPVRYLAVQLSRSPGVRDNRPVHQLVLEAFVGPRPSEAYVGCHNDGDPTNNSLSNLRWDSRRENNVDTLRHGHNRCALQERCEWGHLLSGPNLTAYGKRRGHRECLACARGQPPSAPGNHQEDRSGLVPEGVRFDLRRSHRRAGACFVSAVEDRLAATLAKHEPDRWMCACGHRPQGGDEFTVAAWGAHVAAVIAAADDLAIIELPTDITPWEVTADGLVVSSLSTAVYTPEVLRRTAAKELAAAKAAEGVSNRG